MVRSYRGFHQNNSDERYGDHPRLPSFKTRTAEAQAFPSNYMATLSYSQRLRIYLDQLTRM